MNQLDPQGFTNEAFWATNWFKRLLNISKSLQEDLDFNGGFIFADRSPYSSSIYSKSGNKLIDQMASESIKELKNNGVHVLTIYLKVDKDILWQRVQDRLKTE